jgi:hypothetical protein
MDRWATDAWLSCPTLSRKQEAPSRSSNSIFMAVNDNDHIGNNDSNIDEQKGIPKSLALSNPPRRRRREVITNMAAVVVGMACGGAGWTTAASKPALALVKGNAPPPPKKVGGGSSSGGDTNNTKPKCTNVEECQAQAEVREQEARELASQGPPPLVTASGTKYRDIETGTSGGGSDVVKEGDDVQVYFKVLKLGKRSYDGLSGEGTVVFSRGTYVDI